MKRITIPTQFISDLFNRACGLMGKICRDNPDVNWDNNVTIYKASATWKDCPIHYSFSGLNSQEYLHMHNNFNFYVLFGMSEALYELGFVLCYDLAFGVPRLCLYSNCVLMFADNHNYTNWKK